MSWEQDSERIAETFRRDGVVFVQGFLSGDEWVQMQSELDRYIRECVPRMPREQVYYEDKSDRATVKQFQNMATYDSFFAGAQNDGKFRRLAELLLGGPVIPKNLQYFNKPPGIGRPTPPHQDGYYFMLQPPEALTMWLAMDNVDEENGCVRYVLGSHRSGMREHGPSTTLGFSLEITDFPTDADRAGEVAFHAAPGDLLAHHAMTIHRAGGNASTTRTRRSLGWIYYHAGVTEDQSAKRAYQAQLDQRLVAEGKI
jgi:phytanoyl-CoA hydroxylase